MPLWRHGPLVSATVDLYGNDRAAVSMMAAPGRWPGHEGSDRLTLVLVIPAVALSRAEDAVVDWLRERLRQTAIMLTESAGPVGASAKEGTSPTRLGLLIVAPRGPGDPRITAELKRSSLGPAPSLGRSSGGSPSLALAAEAVALVGMDNFPSVVRLAAALGIEGLLAWYRRSDPTFQPPQQALAHALGYAVSRMEETGRPPPAELRAAAAGQRKITPMAGGA